MKRISWRSRGLQASRTDRRVHRLVIGIVVGGMLVLPGRARTAAQEHGGPLLYEREVFQYPNGNRPDPFRSLLKDGELGIRIEDVVLRGVLHHEDPDRSVAFLMDERNNRRIQAHAGERIGPLRVLAIHPDRVDILVEELGVVRRETLIVRQPGTRGGGS